MTHKLQRAWSLTLALGLGARAAAALLPITNAGFEDPVVGNGQQNGGGYAVPGWVEFDEQYAWAFDIFNPDAGTIPAEAHSGQNVLLSTAYRPATQSVEQQLGALPDLPGTHASGIGRTQQRTDGTACNHLRLDP